MGSRAHSKRGNTKKLVFNPRWPQIMLLLGVSGIVMFCLTALFFPTSGSAWPAIKAREDGEKYREVVVKEGDTLWVIAKRITQKEDDVRKTVWEIRNLNDLDGSLIRPGQVLKVPITDKTR